jgi:hypothetical protein
MDLRIKLITGAAAAVLALPASASAATEVFAGTTDHGARIAMDVKFNGTGVAKKITEIRATGVSLDCEQSGHLQGVAYATVPVAIKIVDGRFHFERTDTYGNQSIFDGRLKGNKLKRAAGTFTYATHYPATERYPEENCTTGEDSFSMKRGAKDVVPPAERPTR